MNKWLKTSRDYSNEKLDTSVPQYLTGEETAIKPLPSSMKEAMSLAAIRGRLESKTYQSINLGGELTSVSSPVKEDRALLPFINMGLAEEPSRLNKFINCLKSELKSKIIFGPLSSLLSIIYEPSSDARCIESGGKWGKNKENTFYCNGEPIPYSDGKCSYIKGMLIECVPPSKDCTCPVGKCLYKKVSKCIPDENSRSKIQNLSMTTGHYLRSLLGISQTSLLILVEYLLPEPEVNWNMEKLPKLNPTSSKIPPN